MSSSPCSCWLTVLLILGKVNVRRLVGAMLIATAFLRLGGARERLYAFVRRRPDPLLVGLGVLHGLTNLGGGVLMVIELALRGQAPRTGADRVLLRLVGLIQVATLAATTSVDWSPLLPLMAATAYAAVGRHAFQAVVGPAYLHGHTGLMGGYGAALLLTA